VVAAIAVWLAVTGLAGAADVDAARRAIGEMLSASRTMVESGERQNVAQMLAEAERVVMTGEQALAWLPQPGNRHARDAADHVRQAIDHARQVIVAANHGRLDDALAEARRTLGQVRRGAGHAEAL
jgi:hypothetical protein